MSELLNFPREAVALPAADLRALADMLTTMQQACARAAAALIDRLDEHDGDPDADDGNDAEDEFAHSDRAKALYGRQDPDAEVGAYAEWHTVGAARRKDGRCVVNSCGHEDDEDDASDCGLDEGEPDFCRRRGRGPGCAISDPGGCEHDGREQDDGY